MATGATNEAIVKVRGADLPYEDGIPLESSWHLDAIYLLIRLLSYFWREREDVYLGGNMFIYFDPDQVKTRNFRGPDFFVVKGVQDTRPRHSWVVWEEGGLTPDFVIELASASTAQFDLTEKKDIYEQMLRTGEYVVYNPETEKLQGWRLQEGRYEPIAPNEQGRLWCAELGLWLGLAPYHFLKHPEPLKMLRFFDPQGRLVLTRDEAEAQRAAVEAQRAATEAQRAEAEAHRADAEMKARRAAEAEAARLKALLEKKE